jgi:hypothetical protein
MCPDRDDLDAKRREAGLAPLAKGDRLAGEHGMEYEVVAIGGYSMYLAGEKSPRFERMDPADGVVRPCGYIYEIVGVDGRRREIYGDEIGRNYHLLPSSLPESSETKG